MKLIPGIIPCVIAALVAVGAAHGAELSPEWRGKRLVPIVEGGGRAVFSPDSSNLACTVAMKTEPGRGYQRVTEGGIAVAELATGKIMRVVVSKTGAVSAVAWSPDGRRLYAQAGQDLWLVEPQPGKLKARKLAAGICGGGLKGPSVSPDGKYVVVAMSIRGRGGHFYTVVDSAGERIVQFQAPTKPVWSANAEVIFGRDDKLFCLSLPGTKEKEIFSSADYWKGKEPKTHANWLWGIQPICALPDGGIVLETYEMPGPKWRRAAGIVATKGEVFVWDRKEDRSFKPLGYSRKGIGDRSLYFPLGSGRRLLHIDSVRPADGDAAGKTTMFLMDTSSGKMIREIPLPLRLQHEGQAIPASYSLVGSSADGSVTVLSASGRIVTPVGPGRSMSRPHWFGLFAVDIPSGKHSHLELPFGKAPFGGVAVSGSGAFIALKGSATDKNDKRWDGVWLCPVKLP